MDIQQLFRKNIIYYLEKKNKKRIDLSNDLNIPKTVVSSWCNGTNFPRPEKIMLLANYFNIDFIDLFTDKSKENADLEEINNIAAQLDKEYRNIVLEQAKTLLKMQKKK